MVLCRSLFGELGSLVRVKRLSNTPIRRVLVFSHLRKLLVYRRVSGFNWPRFRYFKLAIHLRLRRRKSKAFLQFPYTANLRGLKRLTKFKTLAKVNESRFSTKKVLLLGGGITRVKFIRPNVKLRSSFMFTGLMTAGSNILRHRSDSKSSFFFLNFAKKNNHQAMSRGPIARKKKSIIYMSPLKIRVKTFYFGKLRSSSLSSFLGNCLPMTCSSSVSRRYLIV